MSWHRWVVRGVLGVAGWAWLGLGLAQAGAVPPTDPLTLKQISSQVTVSLYQLDSSLPATVSLQSPSRCTTTGAGAGIYRDVTDCWLPELGKVVYVVVNGSTSAPTLVPPAGTPTFPLASGAANPFVVALTTSAYPGQCTNFGAGTDADFTPLGPKTQILISSNLPQVDAYPLTPNDCGGMAVVQVVQADGSKLKFILPKDGTTAVAANGIPEVWENLHGNDLNPLPLNPADDKDTGPVATSPTGDGLSTFDEYRGFIVSGKQIRTNPNQKDLFLRLVASADAVVSPSCGTSCFGGGTAATYPAFTAPSATLTVPAAAGTLGAIATFTTSAGVFSNAHVQGEIIGTGTAGGQARILAVAGPTSVTAEVIKPFLSTSLATGTWKVRESLFAVVYTLLPPEQVHFLQTAEWVDKLSSVLPPVTPPQILNVTDFGADRTVNVNRIYGSVQKGMRVMEGLNVDLPSTLGWAYGIGSPNDAGNVILFSQRIINYITTTLSAATTFKYANSELVNGLATWQPVTTLGSDIQSIQSFILSKAFQFYAAMEVHHSLNLTPDLMGTSRTSYGHHFAPGTGDCLDQAITATSKSGTVTFWIPSVCGNVDQSQAHIH